MGTFVSMLQVPLSYMLLLHVNRYQLLGDGRSCVDVDECKKGDAVCNGGKCINVPGSYRCTCEGGLQYAEDGVACQGTWQHTAQMTRIVHPARLHAMYTLCMIHGTFVKNPSYP